MENRTKGLHYATYVEGDIPQGLEDYLPHGSGIDTDWYLERQDDIILASNSYHAMDEYGGYDSWWDFTVELTITDGKVEIGEITFDDDLEDCPCGDALEDYLWQTLDATLSEGLVLS